MNAVLDVAGEKDTNERLNPEMKPTRLPASIASSRKTADWEIGERLNAKSAILHLNMGVERDLVAT